MCVCVCTFVISSNRGRKCDTLLSDRGRFENGDDPTLRVSAIDCKSNVEYVHK